MITKYILYESTCIIKAFQNMRDFIFIFAPLSVSQSSMPRYDALVQ